MEIKLSSKYNGYVETDAFGTVRNDSFELMSRELGGDSMRTLNNSLLYAEVEDDRIKLDFHISSTDKFDLTNFLLNKIDKKPSLMNGFCISLNDMDDLRVGFVEIINVEEIERDGGLLTIIGEVRFYKMELV
jgi:hypothetical protein